MSDEENSPQEEADAGAPAWVMTFADLMSLLMCFFVLLLAFSEMDVQKFKQIAGSMKVAFGVQREVRAHEIPKGTSTVVKEFSPAKAQPTILNEVRQKTVDRNRKKLEQQSVKSKIDIKKTEKDAKKIAKALNKEIKAGQVEVETQGNKIVIRILEKGSFPSGTSDMHSDFQPVMKRFREVIGNVKGTVKISGHTDDIPIATSRFRSNWELSTARAVSVAHALLEKNNVTPDRIQVIGHADTRPRFPNDSPENRAKNRRVDITIVQSDMPTDSDTPTDEKSQLPTKAADAELNSKVKEQVILQSDTKNELGEPKQTTILDSFSSQPTQK